MVDTNRAVASVAATKKKRLSRILMANLVVFVMVSSAFFVAVAVAASTQPKVWTNAQEYFPGEPVVILGEGFLAGPVTITLSHWSNGVQDVNYRDIAIVGSDGKFRFEGYSAESVGNPETPVKILAYQDAQHQATGSFVDPSATEKIEGFTLGGSKTWTTGDTKGYNEGDSIPMRLYVPNEYSGPTVTLLIAVDYIDTTKGYPIYGMDYLTRVLYTPDPPVPPWNIYTNMTGTPGWSPFSVDPSMGTITGWQRVKPNLVEPNQILQKYEVTMQWASVSVPYAYIHFGAHLAVSNLPSVYGSSFYPGSNLHARYISVNGVDVGNKELPIPCKQVLTPPNMHISKVCDPEVVPLGGVVTFTIDMWNTGEADALSVVLVDTMPMVVSYLPGTAQYWTTQTNTWQPFRDPDSSDALTNSITWNIGTIRGTDKDNDGNPLLPVFHYKVMFSVQVDADALPKTYTNFASITHTDAGGNLYGPITANCSFDVVVVEFEKFADRECAAIGEVVTYWFILRNPSMVTLTYKLWDPLFKPYDVNDPLWTGTLPPKSVVIIDSDDIPALAHTVTVDDEDHLINTATVSFTDGHDVEITLVDSWEVDILHPAIEITKDANMDCAAEGDTVTFTITVTNPTEETEMWYTVHDPLLAPEYGDPLWSGYLAPGDSKSMSFDYLVPDIPVDPNDPFAWELVNTVCVDANDYQYVAGQPWSHLHIVHAEASVAVDIYHPAIEIEKWADKTCAAEGEIVTYFIQVTNPTLDTPMDFELSDPILGGVLWGPGSMDMFGYPYWTLAPGESVLFGGDPSMDIVPNNGYVYLEALAYEVPAGGLDPYTNMATVVAWDPQAHYVSATSEGWNVDVRHVDIEISKWADKTCAAIGEDVTYFITVTNMGDTPEDFVLTDSLLGTIWGFGTGITGDKFNDPYWTLAPGDSVTFGGDPSGDVVYQDGYVYIAKMKYTITGDEEVDSDGMLVNIAEAFAWDNQYIAGDQWADLHSDIDISSWEVDVRIVDIDVYKYADKTCAAIGEDVTYFITVTNTGNTPEDFILTDSLLGTIWGYGTGITGDKFNDPYWTLAPGESVTFGGDPSGDVVYQDGYVYLSELKYTITGDEQLDQFGMLVNTARVFAWDDQYREGDQWADLHSATDESSWEVDVRIVSIEVYKSADKSCAAVGEVVVYTITVTNTGNTPEDFILTDDLLGTIWGYGTGITGGNFNDPYWTLAPGESVTFGGDPSADVVFQDGYVYIPKMAYTITGEEFGDPQVPGDGMDPLVNTASVFAWDDQYDAGDLWAALHSDSDSSSWTVDVRHPGIVIDKYADKSCAAVGEDVAYFFYVKNTGDTTLTFELYDDLFGGLGYVGTLDPGQDILLYYVYTVTGTEDLNGDGIADDPLVNTAYVNGWDDQYDTAGQWAYLHFVTSTDQWSLDVRHVGISVIKTADKTCAAVGETVIYAITVINTGDTPLDFILTDDLLGTIWGYGTGITGDNFNDPYWTLAPGEAVTFGGDINADVVFQDGYVYIAKMAYTVTGEEFGNPQVPYDGMDPYTNTASVFAWDDQYADDQWAGLHSDSDSSSWTVDVRHVGISILKTADKNCAAIGELVTYQITVINTGDTPEDFILTDDLLGTIWGYGTGILGDMFSDPYWTLAPGESVTFGGDPFADIVYQDGYVYIAKMAYTVTEDDADPLVNTASVFAWDDQYVAGDQWANLHSASASSSWTIDVRHVDIEILKWADKYCAAVGEDVNYFIQVYNPTDTWLNFTVTDWLLGFIWGAGSVDMFGTPYWPLAPGETIVFGGDQSQDFVPNNGYVYVPALKHTVTDTDSDPLMNFAWVEVWDDQYVPGDEWSFLHWNFAYSNEVLVDVRHIEIEITKWADKTCAAVGEKVKYYIFVYNPTDTVLDFTLTDSQLGFLWGPGSVDMWGYPYWSLQPYDSIEFGGEMSIDTAPNNGYVYLAALDHTVTADDDDPLINTATITVWDDQWVLGDQWADLHTKTVTTDPWTVDIRHMGIEITKWADKECAAVGEHVTYFIMVYNPTDTTLYFSITDSQLGLIWGPGMFDMWGYPYWPLAPGEFVEFGGVMSADTAPDNGYVYLPVLDHEVTADDDDPLINVATITVWDDQWVQGDQWAYLHTMALDSGSWTVDIRHMGIEVWKWADKECAAVGEDITYSIEVYNPTDTTLFFTITDSQLGLIWGPGMFDMWGYPYWPLAPGEVVIFSGDPSGDLAPDNGYVYLPSLVHTVTVDDDDPLINVATVTVWDDQWVQGDQWAYLHTLTGDSNSWTVDIRHMGIEVWKWADKECAAVGEDIIYTIEVYNPTDTVLEFTIVDSKLGLIWGPGMFDMWGYPYWPLAPGEVIIFSGDPSGDFEPNNGYVYLPSLVHTVTVNDDDPLINVATVTVWDDQWIEGDQWASLHTATADSNGWTVDVRHLGLIVTKFADKTCAEIGETVKYFIDVYNPTDTVLDFTLSDSQLGYLWGPGSFDMWGYGYWSLAPGEFVEFGGEMSYDSEPNNGYVYLAALDHVVTANDPDRLTNYVTMTEWDDQYFEFDQWSFLHIRTSFSNEWTVDILHPAIAIVKIAYPTQVMVGDYVIYEITVTNPSPDTWMNFTLFDSMFGLLWGFGTGITGDNFNDPYWPLMPGESVTFGGNALADVVFQDGYVFLDELLYQTQDTDVPEIHNVATVTAWDYQLHYREASDDATVEVQLFAHLSGYVYQDNDLNDGLMGAGDVGLLNWRVTLVGTDIFGNPVNRFVFSDASGFYDFGDVVPGTYTVAEVLVEHPGWVNTGPVSYAFNIAGGEDKRYDFGNIQYGRITGVKFLDDHMNGYQDLAPWPEPGLEGWIIHLDGVLVNGDEVHLTTTTGPDGSYAFENLLPGIYDVWEEVPPGWVSPVTGSIYHDVEIQSGWEITCCKFGNVRLESICGWKFLDWNMNRVKDGEPGIAGWKITLIGWLNDGVFPFGPDGTPVGPITIETDANGVWCFTDLLPGVYVITEESRDGWYHTTPMSVSLAIASFHGVSQIKFGNVPMTAIKGYKFFDKDMDGVMDGGEPGLAGWTVTLEQETSPGVWTPWGSTTTDPTGAYEFKWLLPGNYRVNEILPAGWFATSSLPMLVVIPPYTVSHQTEPACVVANIGNVMYGTICGYKFEDKFGPNGEYPNGIMDADEYGVGNWEIKLDGRQVNGVRVTLTTYTNNIGPVSDIGKYVFANLLPGIYWVNETLLANWIPTTTCVSQLWLPAYPWWPVKLVQNFGNSHPADPEMNFVLKQGMNLWSSPLQLSMQMRASELAAAIGPNCQMIYKWNATTQSWQTFIPGFTPVNSWKDFRLKNGEGYYVYSKTFTTFRLSGDLITTATVSLLQGTNLIGYDSLKPLTASQFVSLVGVQNGNKVQMVSMWNENTNSWQSFIPGFTPAGSFKDFTMSQGHSYLVYASGPIVVSLPMA